MLPSRIVLDLSPSQFAYLSRAVERDADDAVTLLLGEESPDAETELANARRMQRYLKTVEQTQVYSH
jgi:hypothetical protein